MVHMKEDEAFLSVLCDLIVNQLKPTGENIEDIRVIHFYLHTQV